MGKPSKDWTPGMDTQEMTRYEVRKAAKREAETGHAPTYMSRRAVRWIELNPRIYYHMVAVERRRTR